VTTKYEVDVVTTLTLTANSHWDAQREAEEFTQACLDAIDNQDTGTVIAAEFGLSTVTVLA